MAGLIPAGAAMSGAYAASAVLGEDLTGSAFLGGLVAASMTTGSALASLPLARLMAARGRRPGLLVGYLTGILGALLAVSAALTGWYVFLVFGMLGIGAGHGANLAAKAEIVILNKCDALNDALLSKQRKSIAEAAGLGIDAIACMSGVAGTGVTGVLRRAAQMIKDANAAPAEPAVFTP